MQLPNPTRRSVALGLAATGILSAAGRSGWADGAEPAPGGPGLGARAKAKGLLYGSAVLGDWTLHHPDYAATVLREDAIVVPEYELKWATVEPQPGHLDFTLPDGLLDWAEAQGLLMRGTTLVWHNALPAWLPQTMDAATAGRLLDRFIQTAMGRYRGRIHSWDVVNEAIEPKDGRADGLRDTIWLRSLGPGYIDAAFRLASALDPHALLTLNEYGLEYDTPEDEARRIATLNLLKGMKSRGVPVEILGIEGHLAGAGKPFDPARFRRFLDAVAALGLKIMVTELDVTDDKLPADEAMRDRAVAARTAEFLGVVCDHPATIGILVWGIGDDHTWLDESPDYKRRDGLAQRPLPLDAKYARKPMWQAIADALSKAPRHRA